MLFNSPEFLFDYLPATLAAFFLLGLANTRLALGLLRASLTAFTGRI